ncbi:ABCA5 protein, partial [Columbina picui]|nr:ABCA5 protein [Columbina picui]
LCSIEPTNCLPVLVNVLSNAFLRLFNSTARIRIWSSPFYRMESSQVKESLFTFFLTYMLTLAAGLPPHFAMSSMEDYKVKS